MNLLPQGLSLPFGDGRAEEGGGTSGLRLYRLAWIFGKWLFQREAGNWEK
jgi:hypothetical protein